VEDFVVTSGGGMVTSLDDAIAALAAFRSASLGSVDRQ